MCALQYIIFQCFPVLNKQKGSPNDEPSIYFSNRLVLSADYQIHATTKNLNDAFLFSLRGKIRKGSIKYKVFLNFLIATMDKIKFAEYLLCKTLLLN